MLSACARVVICYDEMEVNDSFACPIRGIRWTRFIPASWMLRANKIWPTTAKCATSASPPAPKRLGCISGRRRTDPATSASTAEAPSFISSTTASETSTTNATSLFARSETPPCARRCGFWVSVLSHPGENEVTEVAWPNYPICWRWILKQKSTNASSACVTYCHMCEIKLHEVIFP